jgi:ubiquinone biosynthesis monooxygenase Coq6
MRAMRRGVATRARADVADVLVVGGGVAGAALACALRARDATKDLRVVVVDGGDAQSAPKRDDAIDARCVALTPRSRAFLAHECDGAWDEIERAGRARAFDAMQAWDGVGGGHATYDARELGAASLGTVAENRVVLWALERAGERLGVERVARARVTATKTPEEDASGTPARATVVVEDAGKGGKATTTRERRAGGGEASERTMEIDARLIVAADGPKSATRTAAGIKVGGWGYGQRAVVGTVRTDRAHSTAWQRFLPTGPIALLPIGDGTYSNVVWTTTPSEAKRLAEDASDAEFAQAVHDALQGQGAYKSQYQEDFNRFATLRFVEDVANQVFKPLARAARTTMSKVVGVPAIEGADEAARLDFAPPFRYPPDVLPAGEGTKRGSFPLSTHHATRLIKPRLALIGDAAHVVHPLGGQGLNLGLRDAELLANAIADARALGQDIGSVNALNPYARASVAANAPMMAALDGLQKLFANDTYPVALARSLGLAAVNATGPVRRKIAWYAMGGA